jgi:hypothetical protein
MFAAFQRLQKLFVDFSTLLGATPQPSLANLLVGKVYGVGHTMFQIPSLRVRLWVLLRTQNGRARYISEAAAVVHSHSCL